MTFRNFAMPLIVLAASPSLASAQSSEERIEPSPKDLAAIQALTPEGVAANVTVHDDDLEIVATLTTEAVFKTNGKFTDRVKSDNFFRAFIAKRDGKVTYQLYQRVLYSSADRDFTSVTYATPDGPRPEALAINDSKISMCYGSFCSRAATLAFSVPVEEMKRIAAMYMAGNSPFWRFKFRSRTGIDWEDRISPAEAAGLLIAVEKYQKDRLPK